MLTARKFCGHFSVVDRKPWSISDKGNQDKQ